VRERHDRRRGRAALALSLGVALATGGWCAPRAALADAPPAAPAEPGEEPRERYFYHGYDYGSQGLYSPLYVFVNRGFDVLQTRVDSRNVFTLEYKSNGVNVLTNLANPLHAVGAEGWGRFLREEVFPLSYKKGTARWVPNYSLHLIAGGMTFRAMREWYEDHGWPAPTALSATTLMATALLNETIENKGVVGRNTDAVADWYFFDIGGILLFSFAPANVLFSKYIIIADWSPPPALTYPGLELHNHGNNFSAKVPLPFYPRLRLFSYFGLSSTGGLSLLIDGGYSISASAGLRSSRLVSRTNASVHNDVQFTPTAGVFLDRNNSLLASVVVSDVQDYFINVNLFPGLVSAAPGVGLWAVLDRGWHPIIGISTSVGFGAGVGK
jgi:hypothetical protein